MGQDLRGVPPSAIIKRDWREVYKLIKEGEIPSYRVGPRSIRIDRAELDTWVRTNEWTEEVNSYRRPGWWSQ
jgi:excisionase family DNA binding protein